MVLSKEDVVVLSGDIGSFGCDYIRAESKEFGWKIEARIISLHCEANGKWNQSVRLE